MANPSGNCSGLEVGSGGKPVSTIGGCGHFRDPAGNHPGPGGVLPVAKPHQAMILGNEHAGCSKLTRLVIELTIQVEGEGGWFRRTRTVPMPKVGTFAQLNAYFAKCDATDDQRRVGQRVDGLNVALCEDCLAT